MSQGKGWIIGSLVIGLLAVAILLVYGSLSGQVGASYYSVAGQLFKDNQDAKVLDSQRMSNDLLLMEIICICLLTFSAGLISAFLWNPLSPRPLTQFAPALVSAGVVAMAIDTYMLATWIDSVHIYMTVGTMDSRPFEPAIFPVMVLLMAVATFSCMIPAVAGGWLVVWKTQREDIEE